MAYGGEARSAVIVMWALTLLTLTFVILRAYTRVWVVHSYGIDDHVYNLAFVLLLCYVVFVTVSGHYGFGQNMTDITNPDNVAIAVLFEAIGQTFAVVGMAVAKWSLGLFLLRLVTKAWHKAAIWIAMVVLMSASISVCFVFWLQCTPPSFLWDRRIPGGYCHIDSTPVSMLLCILCVLVDFFFALFPWLFIWSLRMNKREKIVVLLSLSLGVIAGACGIKRTLEVPELSSQNYLRDTVGLIVWSAAEISVTMICIGIPVCRPLYKNFLEGLMTQSNDYHRSGSGEPQIAMYTFGGSSMKPQNTHMSGFGKVDSYPTNEQDTGTYVNQSPGLRKASRGAFSRSGGLGSRDDASDEEALNHAYRGAHRDPETDALGQNIKVTEEFRVTSTSRC